ncbi:MAG: hypothetical protein U0R65_09295 [Candidatus Nanopelagicales bacterium]|jgi:uncharacterized integral membrane protein
MTDAASPWYLDSALLVGVGAAVLALGGTVWAAGVRSRGRRAKLLTDVEILAGLPPDFDGETRQLLRQSIEDDVRALVDTDGSRAILRVRWLVLGLVAVSLLALAVYADAVIPSRMDEWTAADRTAVIVLGMTFAGLVAIAAAQLARIQRLRRRQPSSAVPS